VPSGNWVFNPPSANFARIFNGRSMPQSNRGQHRKSADTGSIMRQLAPYLTLGTQMAVTVLFLAGAGWWIDDSFETSPWGLVIGSILGCVIGFYQFLHSLQVLLKREKERQTEGRK